MNAITKAAESLSKPRASRVTSSMPAMLVTKAASGSRRRSARGSVISSASGSAAVTPPAQARNSSAMTSDSVPASSTIAVPRENRAHVHVMTVGPTGRPCVALRDDVASLASDRSRFAPRRDDVAGVGGEDSTHRPITPRGHRHDHHHRPLRGHPHPTTVRSIGAVVGVVAACLTTLFAHGWPEAVSMTALIAVVTGVVFGWALPRSLPRGGSGGWALGYAVVAALLVVPAFWTGVPFVLGVAAVIEGNAGRTARSGAGISIAAVVLGALTSLFYLFIYASEALAGNTGFLFG